jgi:hypothetical protein
LVLTAAVQAAPPIARKDGDGAPLPVGAVARLKTIHLRDKDTPTAQAFSSDGKLLAASAGETVLYFWNPTTLRLIRYLLAPERRCPGAGAGPLCRRAASCLEETGRDRTRQKSAFYPPCRLAGVAFVISLKPNPAWI